MANTAQNSSSRNPNSLGGSALYNLLLNADKLKFNAAQYAIPSGSSYGINNSKQPGDVTAVDSSTNRLLVKNLPTVRSRTLPNGIVLQSPAITTDNALPSPGNSNYQYDMFDRLSFGGAPNTNNGGFAEDNIVPRNKNVDNRILINYKNNIEITKLNSTNNDDRTFINKIKIDTKFNSNEFKDPSIETIVSRLDGDGTINSSYPAAKISFSDFLYCKKLGAYPNNRLVIVRRFFQPMDDNIFDSNLSNTHQYPLSVMVNWFDEFPISISFGETWTSNGEVGIIEELTKTISSLVPNFNDSIDTKKTKIGNFVKNVATGDKTEISAPWLKTLFYQFLDNVYSSSTDIPPQFKNVLTEANPNLIRDAVIKRGLTFSCQFVMDFTYVMRYVNGIDPHIAMHNIIANGVRMGTSTSVSIFPTGLKTLPTFVSQLNNGKVIDAMQTIYQSIQTYLSGLLKTVNDKVNKSLADLLNDAKNTVETFGKTYARQLFSLYRFKLTAALQADLGLPSGSWHVTIGNPFNPIVSIGDMVIDDQGITMSFNNELSYDDKPTEINFRISLKAARTRGAQEIERIFNAGRGRIYVYPQIDDDPDLFLSDDNPAMGYKAPIKTYDANSFKTVTN